MHLSASSLPLTRLIELMIFLVEEREAIKSDHLVCYPAFAKLIRHCLCHHQNNLRAAVISLVLYHRLVMQWLTIVGRMYVRAPVSSNMMTTTVTVIRMIPLLYY